jgi:phosphoglycolate phosphatase-like HAD superfamily hydrolase
MKEKGHETSMKRQTIAFDLDGTLRPECGEFSCVRTGGLARLISKRSLRRDARLLLRALVLEGNRVIIYSLTNENATKLKIWFWLMGIPIARVITGREHEQHLRKQGLNHTGMKIPHWFGIDLLVDDCPYTVKQARENGTPAVLVTNREMDWTAVVQIAYRLHSNRFRAKNALSASTQQAV